MHTAETDIAASDQLCKKDLKKWTATRGCAVCLVRLLRCCAVVVDRLLRYLFNPECEILSGGVTNKQGRHIDVFFDLKSLVPIF